MEMDALVNQNNFTKGILTLLSDNSGRSYTKRELAEDQHFCNSTQQITKSVELLVKQELVKIKSKGGEICYQAIPAQKK